MYIVVQINNDYLATVLAIHDGYDSAISFLSKHLDELFDSTKTKFRVVQKSQTLFEVSENGFFGKYFYSKFQIIHTEN